MKLLKLFGKIFIVLALLAATAVFAFVKNPALFARLLVSAQGYRLEANSPYGALPRQTFDLYRPDNLKPDAPLLIFFHGGGWSMGNKDMYRFVGQAFASQGVLVAIPGYRIYPQVVFPDFMHDAAKAAAAIEQAVRRDHGGRHRLFLAGHSAGAHIAVLLALDKTYLKAAKFDAGKIAGVIGLSGPYDFLPLTEDKYKKIFPESTRAASQPINFVSGKIPPMLLLTGVDDTDVRPGNTERLAKKINASGGSAVTRSYPATGHLGTLLALYRNWPFSAPPVESAMRDFLASHAK